MVIASFSTLGAATAAVTAALAMTPTTSPSPTVTPTSPSPLVAPTDPTPTDPTPTGDPFTEIQVSVHHAKVGDQPSVRVQVSTGPSGMVLLDVARAGGGYHVQRFKEFKNEPVDGVYDVRFTLRRVNEPGRYRIHAMFRDNSDGSWDADQTSRFRVRR